MSTARGAKASLLIFWDYDTQWGADRSRSRAGAQHWGPLEFQNTERLLELHARYSVPACFAVVGSAALPGSRPYHDPDQIRRVHAAGHEIASHSHRHEWLPALSLNELKRTLAESKDVLEQCIGHPVRTFVPPFNQPFDCPARGSISLSERRECGSQRVGLSALCAALKECGYSFCRVSYRSVWKQFLSRLGIRRIEHPVSLEKIAGLACVRLNTEGGFAENVLQTLELCRKTPGIIVAYGHPHSLTGDNPQNERWLVPFLERVSALRAEGVLEVRLPREL